MLAWASSTSRTLTAGSRPLCLRAVVCCPAPLSACALRGRRHMQLDVLLHVDIMRIQLYGAQAAIAADKTPQGDEDKLV